MRRLRSRFRSSVEKTGIISSRLWHEEDSEFPRAVGPEDQNPFDVAGPTRSADETDEGGIVRGVFAGEQREGGGQIGYELVPACDHQMMRRKHAQGPPPRAQCGYTNAAGLRHQTFA